MVYVMNGKTVSILNQRSEKYEKLKAEADAAGLSVEESLYQEWDKTRPKFTIEELRERLRTRERVKIDAAALIREGREERDAQVDEWLKDIRVRR